MSLTEMPSYTIPPGYEVVRGETLPLVKVPLLTYWDEPTQRWTFISPAWQDDMAAVHEKWLRSREYETNEDLRREVHTAITADEASNCISPAHAKHLRGVWSDVTGGVR